MIYTRNVSHSTRCRRPISSGQYRRECWVAGDACVTKQDQVWNTRIRTRGETMRGFTTAGTVLAAVIIPVKKPAVVVKQRSQYIHWHAAAVHILVDEF